ncbi:unnamed protein product [Cyclocybe aegerita]|uniref:Uncharacterized protein n=1 Tax=Cyclocybe aegerita TaxID=1973307 RepID=A0A8S0XF68_CYCAE|nr:unnamed protein product [Cyclocybe aegerita]
MKFNFAEASSKNNPALVCSSQSLPACFMHDRSPSLPLPTLVPWLQLIVRLVLSSPVLARPRPALAIVLPSSCVSLAVLTSSPFNPRWPPWASPGRNHRLATSAALHAPSRGVLAGCGLGQALDGATVLGVRKPRSPRSARCCVVLRPISPLPLLRSHCPAHRPRVALVPAFVLSPPPLWHHPPQTAVSSSPRTTSCFSTTRDAQLWTTETVEEEGVNLEADPAPEKDSSEPRWSQSTRALQVAL